MSAGHRHHLHANEAQDLTHTTTLHRREFAPAMTKRFRRLKGLIRATVSYEHDALRLSNGTDSSSAAPTDTASLFAASPAERFEFTNNGEAVDEFMEWLQGAIAEDVLEVVGRDRVRNGEHYTAGYVRSAYQRGLKDAARRLQAAGYDVEESDLQDVFNLPVHQRTIESVYTRTYSELEGITTNMQQGVRRTLSRGLAEGWNPRKAASRLNEEVDDIGITRARTLSRTEISKAYNTASGKRYERHGVEEVDILTSNPCSVCKALAAGGPYPVSEASTLIPDRTHPNCVCTIAPAA